MNHDDVTRCPYCGTVVTCTPHTIALAHEPRLQVRAGAGHCDCGFIVLTECAQLAIDQLLSAMVEPTDRVDNRQESKPERTRNHSDASERE